MDRRRFLLISLAGALTAPLAAEAQHVGKVYRIGILTTEPAPTQEERAKSPFLMGLAELGWIEGRNLTVEARRSPSVERLDALAAELVTLKVEVIYAVGTPASLAARRATHNIPIVMIVGIDPVADGLVASLSRPGGNITGVTALSSELIEKRLGVITEIIPRGSRVAYMWNPANPGNVSAWEQTKKVAQTIRLPVQPVRVASGDELEGAFIRLTRERIGGLLVGADGMLANQRARLADLALKHRIPTMYSSRVHADAGGLIAYSADWDALRRRAAVFIDRILRGAKPSNLPIEQPTKFELVINLKTAKALGLTIPPSLLARADQIIE
jgi:putative ABC transport system substrate-binding protein